MDTEFKVKAGEFEGPLELLLELVEKRKFHVSDISLSQVADEFIEHIKSFENFPMGDSAEFLLIASTLLLIKSKSLLPNLDLTPEEKVSIEELEKRLALYQKYRDASVLLRKMFGERPLYFAEEKKNIKVVFAPTAEVTAKILLSHLKEALKNVPRPENLPKVSVRKVVSLEETIESLRRRMEKAVRMSFSEFAKPNKNDKIMVIVSFLAMLELVKQGILRAEQSRHFEEIDIESEGINTPTY